MKKWFATLLILLIHTTGFAQKEKDLRDWYLGLTPQQVIKLSKQKGAKTLPNDLLKIAKQFSEDRINLEVAKSLNMLMYPGIHDLSKAKKDFQNDLNAKPTGTLTFGQVLELFNRADSQKTNRVLFLAPHSHLLLDSIANVQGTLTFVNNGEKPAYPVNHTKISCLKDEGYCEKRVLALQLPDVEPALGGYQLFESDVIRYKIIYWEDNSIKAIQNSNSSVSGCRISSLDLNFATQEFLLLSQTSEDQSEYCKDIFWKEGKPSPPRISKIVDGKEIIQKEFEELQTKAFNYLSSEYRKQLNKAKQNQENQNSTSKR